MFGYFPSLQPGESVYGGVSRLAGTLGSDVTGQFFIDTSYALPRRLSEMASAFWYSGALSMRRLLEDHSSLPYVRCFLEPPDHASLEKTLMPSRGKGWVPLFPRHLEWAGEGNHLRFCRECAIEDIRLLGMATWRTVNHLPAVLVCPDHVVALAEIKLERRTKTVAVLNEETISSATTCEIGSMSFALPLATATKWLLNNRRKLVEPAAMVYRLLAKAGIASRAQSTPLSRLEMLGVLEGSLIREFGSEALSLVGICQPSSQISVLPRLVRSRREITPVKWLLIFQMLKVSPEEVFLCRNRSSLDSSYRAIKMRCT